MQILHSAQCIKSKLMYTLMTIFSCFLSINVTLFGHDLIIFRQNELKFFWVINNGHKCMSKEWVT